MGTICFFVNINKALFISVVFTLFYKDMVTPDTQAKIKKKSQRPANAGLCFRYDEHSEGGLLREKVGYRNTPKKN